MTRREVKARQTNEHGEDPQRQRGKQYLEPDGDRRYGLRWNSQGK
jgi:hypothetical protein